MTSPHVSVKTMLLVCAVGCAAWVRPVSPEQAVVRAGSQSDDRPAARQAQQDQPSDRPSDRAGSGDRPAMRPAARGGQPQRGRFAQPLWDRLDDQERRRLRAFVQEHFPEVFAELEWLEANRPRQAINRMRRFAPEMLRFRELMKRNPGQARLAIEERRLDLKIVVRVRDYWASDSEIDRAELRDEITELVQRLFDVRLQRRKLEVERLRDRLEGLQRRLEHAEENRDAMIERQISGKLDQRTCGSQLPPDAVFQPSGYPLFPQLAA